MAKGTPHGAPRRWLTEMVARAMVERPDQCITDWPYARLRGYPIIRHTTEKRNVRAHSVVLELSGRPRPPGQEGRHLCGNGLGGCLNPWHLAWGTHRQNGEDMRNHGSAPRGERNGNGKLSEEEARAIKAAVGTHRAIAERFGVSDALVSRIRSGHLWGHLP